MKKAVVLLVTMGLLVTGLACTISFPGGNINVDLDTVEGSGDVIEETREVRDFSQVRLSGFGTLLVEQGESESLRIEAEENFMQHIISEVEGDILVIRWERGVVPVTSERIIYYVTVEELEALELNGAGDVEVEELETGDLRVSLNGAGDIEIAELVAETLNIELSGAGDVTISGEVDVQDVSLDAAGSYNARHLESRVTEIAINGVGSATVNVSDELTAVINGAGSIRYVGNPEVDREINGVGDIERID